MAPTAVKTTARMLWYFSTWWQYGAEDQSVSSLCLCVMKGSPSPVISSNPINPALFAFLCLSEVRTDSYLLFSPAYIWLSLIVNALLTFTHTKKQRCITAYSWRLFSRCWSARFTDSFQFVCIKDKHPLTQCLVTLCAVYEKNKEQ